MLKFIHRFYINFQFDQSFVILKILIILYLADIVFLTPQYLNSNFMFVWGFFGFFFAFMYKFSNLSNNFHRSFVIFIVK